MSKYLFRWRLLGWVTVYYEEVYAFNFEQARHEFYVTVMAARKLDYDDIVIIDCEVLE